MIRDKSRRIKLLTTALIWVGFAEAQTSFNATGGNASGNGGSVSYSIGQVVYATNTDVANSTIQGVQQAYEVFTLNVEEIELNISLFPNPTTSNLTLQINDFNDERLTYRLFDAKGKLLENRQVSEQQSQINMVNLPSATYFIHTIDHESRKRQSFKVIKY